MNPNTAVVLHNGSPVEAPWAEQTAAVLEMYLGGQGVGEAEDALLFGEKNPSGHLAESFPLRLEDNPSYLNFNTSPEHCIYAEGIYVGYRYYEKKKMPVRWTFGRGLSYTAFTVGNIRLSSASFDDEGTVDITADVTNTGEREGKAVVQLYIRDENGTPDRPVKELKGFAKVMLKPGETKSVTMTINALSLSYYEERLGDWYAPSGTYTLLLGDASDHITAETALSFSTKKTLPIREDGSMTIGELRQDPRTAAAAKKILSYWGPMKSPDIDENDPLLQEMTRFMPLKFVTASGELSLEEAYEMIHQALGGK